MADKEYIVSLQISFITPIGIKAKSKGPAATKAKTQFTKLIDEFKKQLDDIADLDINVDSIDLDIDVDYIEDQGY